jgi:hypothetical protein
MSNSGKYLCVCHRAIEGHRGIF